MAVDRLELAGVLAGIMGDAQTYADDLPARMCQVCLEALPVDGVGLALMASQVAGGRTLLGASDAVGARVEELQFALGDGPCVSAFEQEQPVLVPDLEEREARNRWPLFTAEILKHDARAIFAFPLQMGALKIGVLDCHRTSPGPLVEIEDALVVADVVTVALLGFESRGHRDRVNGDLFTLSWRSHVRVHQAIGVIAGRLGIAPEDALTRLRAYAFGRDRPLDEVATDIVAGVLPITSETL